MTHTNYRTLITLALPAIASALLNNFYRVVDLFSVQWLGTDAQAALGSCSFVSIAFYSMFVLISAGAGPLMARAVGAEDLFRQKKVVTASLILCALTGIIFTIGLSFGSRPITDALGLKASAADALDTYLYTLGISGFFFAFGPLIDALFIASGDTRTPMWLQLCSTLVNAALNFLLIYHWEQGIAGAALASSISRAMVAVMGVWILHIRFGFVWLPSQIMFGSHARMMRIGVPFAMGTFLYALAYWGLLRWAVSPLGPHVNAALGIGFSALEGVSWPLYAGMMMAVSSLIGRQLGAEAIDETERSIKAMLQVAAVLGTCCCIVFLYAAEPLCGLFTQDPEVLKEAILYARILALSQFFVAYEAGFEGVLGGAGDHAYQLWLSAPLNLTRVPLGYLMAIHLDWGAAGVWWAINLTTLLKTIGKGYLVWRGSWKTLELE